jgi:transposase
VVFVGIDWSENHHDVCIVDERGELLAKERVADGLHGVARLHAVVAEHSDDPNNVIVGIEIDCGLFVGALVAAGYEVFAINPLSVDRYRDRHGTSGAKSDPGDAKVLADLVRTDRHNHRPVAGDSDLAERIRVLARTHKSLIWERQRHVNRLRNSLRDFYPQALEAFGTELASGDAVAVLGIAPTPGRAMTLSRSKIASALRRGGRQRNLERKAQEIQQALRSEQLQAPAQLSEAYNAVVAATVALVASLNDQIAQLERELAAHFEVHPDAKIVRNLPGLGVVLGARVVAEFGDDPTRYADAKGRRNYAGTSPITKASGTRRNVLARYVHNDRLFDACMLWAFSSLTKSPGARRYFDSQRAKGKTNNQALRSLANRLVGILHGCLRHREVYREEIAWGQLEEKAA